MTQDLLYKPWVVTYDNAVKVALITQKDKKKLIKRVNRQNQQLLAKDQQLSYFSRQLDLLDIERRFTRSTQSSAIALLEAKIKFLEDQIAKENTRNRDLVRECESLLEKEKNDTIKRSEEQAKLAEAYNEIMDKFKNRML